MLKKDQTELLSIIAGGKDVALKFAVDISRQGDGDIRKRVIMAASGCVSAKTEEYQRQIRAAAVESAIMHEIAGEKVALAQNLQQECARLTAEMVSDKEQLGKAHEYIQALQQLETEHERVLQAVIQERDNLRVQLGSMKSEALSESQRVKVMQDQMAEYIKHIHELYDQLLEDREAWKTRSETQERHVVDVEARLRKVLHDAKSRIDVLQTAGETYQNEISGLSAQLQSAKGELGGAKVWH